MSTSDQDSTSPLTRKQLREIRLTGSTPVITTEQAEAAAAAPVTPPPTPITPPVPPVPPAPVFEEDAEQTYDGAPLTRREAREKERMRTASVSVVTDEDQAAAAAEAEQAQFVEAALVAEPYVEVEPYDEVEPYVEAEPAVEIAAPEVPAYQYPVADEVAAVEVEPYAPENVDYDAGQVEVEQDHFPEAPVVSGVPAFEQHAEQSDENDDLGVDVAIAPVSAAASVDASGDLPVDMVHDHGDVHAVDEYPAAAADVASEAPEAYAGADFAVDERPVVNPAFGEALLTDHTEQPAFAPSFDELLTSGDSTGSQHAAPSALIFTHSPREGSLDGPVAATGEVIITGSYELPRGIGSQGHAHGTTDGKDVDAVLIDGELPPASSPTPIAASAAVSTLKPAGEVIRPPAPEKGNKLMLTLAITAGGLAIVLATALIIAFTTNVI